MTYPELLAAIKRSSMQEIVNSGTDEVPKLLTRACNLFERHRFGDQMTVMACMIGMVLSTMEGEQTTGDQTLGVIITHKERLEIFTAQLMQVFKMGMEARGMPIDPVETPPPASRPQTPGAKVLQIASGKRRKRRKPHV